MQVHTKLRIIIKYYKKKKIIKPYRQLSKTQIYLYLFISKINETFLVINVYIFVMYLREKYIQIIQALYEI